MAKAKTPLERVQGKLEKVSGDGKGVM